jgi:hypothetical protein
VDLHMKIFCPQKGKSEPIITCYTGCCYAEGTDFSVLVMKGSNGEQIYLECRWTHFHKKMQTSEFSLFLCLLLHHNMRGHCVCCNNVLVCA